MTITSINNLTFQGKQRKQSVSSSNASSTSNQKSASTKTVSKQPTANVGPSTDTFSYAQMASIKPEAPKAEKAKTKATLVELTDEQQEALNALKRGTISTSQPASSRKNKSVKHAYKVVDGPVTEFSEDEFKKAISTYKKKNETHFIDRMGERGISQEVLLDTFKKAPIHKDLKTGRVSQFAEVITDYDPVTKEVKASKKLQIVRAGNPRDLKLVTVVNLNENNPNAQFPPNVDNVLKKYY